MALLAQSLALCAEHFSTCKITGFKAITWFETNTLIKKKIEMKKLHTSEA